MRAAATCRRNAGPRSGNAGLLATDFPGLGGRGGRLGSRAAVDGVIPDQERDGQTSRSHQPPTHPGKRQFRRCAGREGKPSSHVGSAMRTPSRNRSPTPIFCVSAIQERVWAVSEGGRCESTMTDSCHLGCRAATATTWTLSRRHAHDKPAKFADSSHRLDAEPASRIFAVILGRRPHFETASGPLSTYDFHGVLHCD